LLPQFRTLGRNLYCKQINSKINITNHVQTDHFALPARHESWLRFPYSLPRAIPSLKPT